MPREAPALRTPCLRGAVSPAYRASKIGAEAWQVVPPPRAILPAPRLLLCKVPVYQHSTDEGRMQMDRRFMQFSDSRILAMLQINRVNSVVNRGGAQIGQIRLS
jgi:hypothetical protein